MTGASWIYTQGTHSGRWVNISMLGMEDAGGIPTAEWLNPHTGSGFLLLPDGKWSDGGMFHLFYKSAGGSGGSKVDNLLVPADPVYRSSPVAWQAVFRRCVDYVNTLIGAEDVKDLEVFAEEWRQSLEQREAEHRAALADMDQPSLEDVVRQAAAGAKERLESIRDSRVKSREEREAAEGGAAPDGNNAGDGEKPGGDRGKFERDDRTDSPDPDQREKDRAAADSTDAAAGGVESDQDLPSEDVAEDALEGGAPPQE